MSKPVMTAQVMAGGVIVRKWEPENGKPFVTITYNGEPITEFGPGSLALMKLVLEDTTYRVSMAQIKAIVQENTPDAS